jgi:Pyruvate/2-oxoacid:ferredoxin oxidoreductase delta subunit
VGKHLITRKIIDIDEALCNGCGQCAIACAEGAIEIRKGKAKVISESFCDGLGACLGECPTGALRITERKADAFDAKAVEVHLADRPNENIKLVCPSSFSRKIPVPRAETEGGRQTPQLSNWPVQLRLAHPSAPYFKGAHLLLAADCSAFAYANMHGDFIRGKVALIACPKLDEVQASIEKLTEILSLNDIRDITVVRMEVPCCSGLNGIVKKALERSKKNVAVTTVTIGTDGSILKGQISD